ncbi:BolA protein [Candida albicans L26]|uniref:BolA protein n=1 Tax=Candida albicans P78048 TaxID=1094989 RepID=A0AB34Q0A7_CANAX|nr:BolA protein [Candida albicans P78048]KGT71817.1 BolA protein [Candida albicans 12C]KGU17301.1 BolA protein [Candida albicans L26]
MLRSFIRRMSSAKPPQILHSETPGPIESSIISKITNEFKPLYFKIDNDSHKHAHHAGIRGAKNKTESHFRLEIVSDVFEGKSLSARHRLVYSLLANELKNDGVHALQMKTKTPEEINKTQN